MKGLIIRDFIMAKTTYITCAMLAVMYAALGFVNLFGTAMVGLIPLIIIPSFGMYDDLGKMDVVMKIAPVSAKDIAVSRHVSAFLVVAVTLLYAFLASVILALLGKSFIENIVFSFLITAISTFVSLICIPAQFKLGAVKAKIFVIVVAVLMGCLAITFVSTSWYLGVETTDSSTYTLIAGVAALLVLSWLISLKLSIIFCKGKEY